MTSVVLSTRVARGASFAHRRGMRHDYACYTVHTRNYSSIVEAVVVLPVVALARKIMYMETREEPRILCRIGLDSM